MLSTRRSSSLNTINFGQGDALWLNRPSLSALNQTNQIIHLSPANGFPVASYKSFLDQLNQRHSITGMDCRGAWPKRSTPPSGFGINDFADDLISGLESQHQQPVIGMGHSHGGLVTVAAAIKRPDLFSKLVIIEGASMPTLWSDAVCRMIPKALMLKYFPIARGSHRRQLLWESREAFYQRYRHHATFKRFTDQDLRAYAEQGLFKRQDGQYELVFDPSWEAHIFCHVRFLWSFLPRLNLPTLLIRAEHGSLYTHQAFEKNNRELGQHIKAIEIPRTHHLLTHEKPNLVTDPILEWLAD